MICPRCTKTLDDSGIHTCAPTQRWREREKEIEAIRAEVAELKNQLTNVEQNFTTEFYAHRKTIDENTALKAKLEVAKDALETISGWQATEAGITRTALKALATITSENVINKIKAEALRDNATYDRYCNECQNEMKLVADELDGKL